MKKIIVLTLCVLFSVTAWSDIRTEQQAEAIAAQFFQSQSAPRRQHGRTIAKPELRLAHKQAKSDSQSPAFYVFNNGDNGGCVIVSADDHAETILGYTEQGQFNYETINPSLRWWLNRYTKQISSLKEDAEAPKEAVSVTAIAPLLGDIEWDQEAPYYNLCPKKNNQRCLTGCVATACAQIMRKWQHPKQGTGSHTNTVNKKSIGNLTVNFYETTYDWANMLPQYTSKATDAQKNAVATLMYHCGVACDMVYDPEGSGAYTDDMAKGLQDYFGYTFTKFITECSKADYGQASVSPVEYNVTEEQLVDYFNADLEAGRPILMGGESDEGGHEFVCDGRDAQGKFHINWGWSGEDNGYFSISSNLGEDYDFSYYVDALIGLQPMHIDTVHVTSVAVTPASVTLKINEKTSLQASVKPANATISYPTWTSSNPQVATVTSGGIVKGIAQGTTTITATAEGKTATCAVTVTSEVAESNAFELVTSVADLAVGDEILIVNEDYSKALGTTQNTNNRSSADVTIRDNQIELEDDQDDVQILTLTAGTPSGTFGLHTSKGYLCAASSTKNYLHTETSLSANSSWDISISGGEATIEAQGSYTRNLIRYNMSSDLFSAYGPTSQMESVAIYARTSGTTPTPPPVEPETITVTGLTFCEAIRYEDGGTLYWDFDIYADESQDYFPEVYISPLEEAQETKIVGTYSIFYAGYWETANDSADAEYPEGYLTITFVADGVYHFKGSFVADDGNTYVWDTDVEVSAYDYDAYEDIILTDGGDTPTPPVTDGRTFTLVTNVSDLKAGDNVLFAATYESVTYAAAASMSSTTRAAFLDVEKVTLTGNTITLPKTSAAAVFTLGANSSNWTLTVSGKKLGATAAKNLAWDKNTAWTLAVDAGKATLYNAANKDFGRFLFNANLQNFTPKPRFCIYTSNINSSTTMMLPCIYKEVTMPTALDETLAPASASKIMHNGQVFILRDGARYTILGIKVE